jgi:hypothetical protein
MQRGSHFKKEKKKTPKTLMKQKPKELGEKKVFKNPT